MNERLTVRSNGMVVYRYFVGPDVGFAFHTLAEVGQPYQQWFRDELARRGLSVETRRINRWPWVADFVVGAKEEEGNGTS